MVQHISEATSAPRSGVRLSMLEGFRLSQGQHEISLQSKAQRLLAFIGLRDRPLLRSHVAGTLWPDTDERHASANLRSALWRLREMGLDIIDATITHLGLARGVTVDVREAIDQAQRLLDQTTSHRSDDEDVYLLMGDLLPDWWDDWVLLERERLRQLRMHALEALCKQFTARGHYAKALEAGLLAVAAEPLRESAHRLVIRVHLEEGNYIEALRQYETYARLLNEDLHLEPSPQIEELVGVLRRRCAR